MRSHRSNNDEGGLPILKPKTRSAISIRQYSEVISLYSLNPRAITEHQVAVNDIPLISAVSPAPLKLR